MKKTMIAMLGIAMFAGVAGAAEVAVITSGGYIKTMDLDTLGSGSAWAQEVDYGDTGMKCVTYDPVTANLIVGRDGTVGDALVKTGVGLSGSWDADKAVRGVNVTDVSAMGNGQFGMVQDGWLTILNANDLANFDDVPGSWPSYGRDLTPTGGDDTLSIAFRGNTDEFAVGFLQTPNVYLALDNANSSSTAWNSYVAFNLWGGHVDDVAVTGNGYVAAAFDNGFVAVREVDAAGNYGGWDTFKDMGDNLDIVSVEYLADTDELVVVGNATTGGFIGLLDASDITTGWQGVKTGLEIGFVDAAVIPEPATLGLLGFSALVLGAVRRFRI